MSSIGEGHKKLGPDGVGFCSRPMFDGYGGPAGFCDKPAFGEPTAEGRKRYDRYVPALACYTHGGPKSPYIDIVFDGPPGPEAGRFVEVENALGQSINAGDWTQRPDGRWVLRIAR